ncbi:divisome-associated lipoprotein DalA [Chachezhania sediminis]|uniref:CAP domain-containing protein n=1 Tax=Chachezhania sediminis TaxID=2599291 RepID=UPI00131ECA26|nr:CAP domain-containing protein [Chachezhania sediminis]
MVRIALLLFLPLLTLAACSDGGGGADGHVYRIRGKDAGNIQIRMLDSINALRSSSGLVPLQMNAQLTSAAATHSKDMSVQNRPWHFGSDGSSPLDRVARAGYPGRLLGEDISETFESELETLGAWVQNPGTKQVIMDPAARDLGFAWYQDSNGKLWWTLITGTTEQPGVVPSAPAVTSEATGIVDLPAPTRSAG